MASPNAKFQPGTGKQVILKSDFVDIELAIAATAALLSAYGLVEPHRDVVASAGVTFTDLVPGAKYRLDYQGIQNTASDHTYLRFNADSGANYISPFLSFYSAGVSHAASTTAIRLGTTVLATSFMSGVVYFESIVGDDTYVIARGQSNYNNTGTRYGGVISGDYNGAAALTSVTFLPASGTFTGRVSLYRVG